MVDAKTDRLIIGAGAVGLAIARQLAMAGDQVVLIESNSSFGMETSSRNSEVIHAGIYYPANSHKARLCVKGAHMMYAYCAARGVKTNQLGKLIVATDHEQEARLDTILKAGKANDVPDLTLIGKDQVHALEPDLRAVAAIHSPFTGVVDSHNYMAALEADAENHGAIIAYQSRFIDAEKHSYGYHVRINSQGEEIIFACQTLINAAGHGAHLVSHAISGIAADTTPPHYMAKGQYFTTTRKPPFQHLIYPVPSGGGLGIHLTLDCSGGARFGPDINWVDQPSYDVDPAYADQFHQSISTYWPALKRDELVPAWAGLRPKIWPDGSHFQDFTFHDASIHGCEGYLALYAIDSPGLTSSLAIAEYVAERLI
ncbi:MAG TPA: FAD-dependent oxidoreductase [Alphaproteobacteria bacterium]|nr:FAD-dependent oxidoreductase [Alphaproteobacteria bacterium]